MVGWVHPGKVSSDMAVSLLRAQTHFSGQLTRFAAIACGPGVWRGRTELMQRWVELGDEPYFLMVDSDMTFEPADIEALLETMEENPELGACSAVCVTWRTFSGLSIPAGHWTEDGEKYTRLTTKPTELLKDVAVGAAFLLIRREAVEAIDVDTSFWTMPGRSEDISFAIKLREAGWPLALDPRASVGHIREYTFYLHDGVDANGD